MFYIFLLIWMGPWLCLVFFQIISFCRSFVVEQKNGALHATAGTEPKPSSRYKDCYVKEET